MQLIILFFISINISSLFAKRTYVQKKLHQKTKIMNEVDPYNFTSILDPSIPNIDPNKTQQHILMEQTKNAHSHFHFTIFPRIISTDIYTMFGLESALIFDITNQTYLNFVINKEYQSYYLNTIFLFKEEYALGIKIKYENVLLYDNLKTLAFIKFKQRLFSEIQLYSGIISSNKNLWPIIGLRLGRKQSSLSYNSDKSYLWLETFIFPRIHKEAFFKFDINYHFSYVLGSSSLLNFKFKYYYTSNETPVAEQIKQGQVGRAYSSFSPISTQKSLYLNFSYSFIFLERTYFALLYEGAFMINTFSDLSINKLQSSYSIELGYVSKSITNLRYFFYFATGEKQNHKFMLGIKS